MRFLWFCLGQAINACAFACVRSLPARLGRVHQWLQQSQGDEPPDPPQPRRAQRAQQEEAQQAKREQRHAMSDLDDQPSLNPRLGDVRACAHHDDLAANGHLSLLPFPVS